MPKTPRQEEILTDLAEALDVDEERLTTPSRLFTALTNPENGFVPDLDLEGREVKVVGTDNVFWVFPTLEAVEAANESYARWLVNNDKVKLPDQAYLNAIEREGNLLEKFVRSIVFDSEEVEDLAHSSPEMFWNIANQFGIRNEDPNLYMTPSSKAILKLRNEYAKYQARFPLQHLIDKVGRKKAVNLIINGVGFQENGLEYLSQYLIDNLSLKPLNIADRVGQTRYDLFFVQVVGSPIKIVDVLSYDIPQPL